MTLKQLREITERASPGPWVVNGDQFPVCSVGNSSEDGNDYHVAGNGYAIRDGAHSDAKDDAEFIAAANPPTVLALLDSIREMEAALEFYADKRNWLIKRKVTASGGVMEKLSERGKTARQALKAHRRRFE